MGHSSYDDYTTQVVMKFGKYKGRTLSTIPVDYLYWLLAEADLYPALEMAVRDEVGRRNGTQQQQAPPTIHRLPVGVTLADAIELIGVGRRSLAKKYHPDAGGSHSKMVAVNNLCDWLESTLRGGAA